VSTLETIQNAGLRVHQWLYEHTDGRVGQKVGKLPALLLRTTGARTGKTRTSALVYGTDGAGRYVVVG
jgi:F420H(2)-dependent quinone reductase